LTITVRLCLTLRVNKGNLLYKRKISGTSRKFFSSRIAMGRRHLYNALDGLRVEDVVIVTGTSETVIPIGRHLLGRPGHKTGLNR
jgi:hypothetical protein